MRFEVGETVLCIESTIKRQSSGWVEKGKIYPVLHVEYCPKCGEQAIDVGVAPGVPLDKWGGYVRCPCGSIHRPISPKLLSSKKFTRVDEKMLEQSVESEEYELSAMIRDVLKSKQSI